MPAGRWAAGRHALSTRDTRPVETGDSRTTGAPTTLPGRVTRPVETGDSRTRGAPAGRGLLGLLGGMLGVLALLAGCTVGPSQRPPVAVRGENVPAPPSAPAAAPTLPLLPAPEPAHGSVSFRDCPGGSAAAGAPTATDRTLRVQCAPLTVEADPGQPGLGRTRVGLQRVGLADAPPDRPPLLVVGDTATQPAAALARTLAAQVPLALLQRYSLVGLDRRGSGLDDLDCGPATARLAFVDVDPETDGAVPGLNALLEQARAVVQDCYLVHAGALTGYRTASTAADVEQARLVLGVAHLSALGVGDGGEALSLWAGTHPDAVGRLVLDAPVNPAQDEPDAGEARAAAAESAFDAFAASCAAGPDCPLGADPRAVVTALVGRLHDQPITAADGRRLTAGMVVTVLLAGLGEPAGWPDLAAAISQVNAGSPDAVLARLIPLLTRGGTFDVSLATACNDARRRMTPVEVGDLVGRWRTAYPLFGPTIAQRLLACGPWPPTSAPPAPDPVGALPPTLVIGTAHDPRGPLEGARRLATTTPGALFLSWQGAGTGAFPRTTCVTAVVDGLLIDGVAPPDGTLCPP